MSLNKIPTPHISALKGQIAKRVLMPGDPVRAKWIATKYLKNPKLVSDVRGMTAFTGTYKNVPVTIMPHGMGIPSICIYSHELFDCYDVKTIYRIGSCGVNKAANCELGDVILAKSCWSDVPTKHWLKIKIGKKLYPSSQSLNLIKKIAKKINIEYKEKDVISTTFFYNESSFAKTFKITGSNVFEMEGFGLFLEAKIHNRNAACLLTVSDNIEKKQSMTSHERATTFNNMVKLALESIIHEKV